MTDFSGLIGTIATALPGIVGAIKANHASTNPNDPPLTDADVIVALRRACDDTLAKDEEILRTHPPDVGGDVPGGGAV